MDQMCHTFFSEFIHSIIQWDNLNLTPNLSGVWRNIEKFMKHKKRLHSPSRSCFVTCTFCLVRILP